MGTGLVDRGGVRFCLKLTAKAASSRASRGQEEDEIVGSVLDPKFTRGAGRDGVDLIRRVRFTPPSR